jgi:hypothetical protein
MYVNLYVYANEKDFFPMKKGFQAEIGSAYTARGWKFAHAGESAEKFAFGARPLSAFLFCEYMS